MKLLLVLALVAATATAHWTHDESLAREIGPPPGHEDDVDVIDLADELISEVEKSGEKTETVTIPDKRFRVTVGTNYYDSIPAGHSPPMFQQWYHGASNSQFEVKLLGKISRAANATLESFAGSSIIQYYVGPAMTYNMAQKVAPQLHPGMVPLITDAERACSGLKPEPMGVLKNCAETVTDAVDVMTRCEPNTKMCSTMLASRGTGAYKVGKVGYAPAKPVLALSATAESNPDANPDMKMGLIQRGQIYGKDVGEISEVEITEQDMVAGNENTAKYCAAHQTAWKCSSPWFPAFVKINTNDPKTGIGNGVYYVHPMQNLFIGSLEINVGNTPYLTETGKLVAKPDALAADATFTAATTHNAQLKKCLAQVCEEEMDKKYGMSNLRTDEFLG